MHNNASAGVVVINVECSGVKKCEINPGTS